MAGVTLEDFDVEPPGAAPEVTPEPAAPPDPPEVSAGYEDGYQAGWDDAVRAQAEDQARIGAEFARNLQEMSFTFHEARAHVIQSMEPLIDELVGTIFPALAADSLVLTIREELRPLIAESADAPVDLMVGPGGRAVLESQVAQLGNAAIRLVEEPTLVEGQAYLRIGKTERQIDLSGALERIRNAVDALYELNKRTLKHG